MDLTLKSFNNDFYDILHPYGNNTKMTHTPISGFRITEILNTVVLNLKLKVTPPYISTTSPRRGVTSD